MANKRKAGRDYILVEELLRNLKLNSGLETVKDFRYAPQFDSNNLVVVRLALKSKKAKKVFAKSSKVSTEASLPNSVKGFDYGRKNDIVLIRYRELKVSGRKRTSKKVVGVVQKKVGKPKHKMALKKRLKKQNNILRVRMPRNSRKQSHLKRFWASIRASQIGMTEAQKQECLLSLHPPKSKVSPVERKTLEDYLIVKKPKKPTDAWEIFQRFLKKNKLIVKKSALLKS